MKKVYTCIICPNGCEIEAEIEGTYVLSVKGHTCDKGETLKAPVEAGTVILKGVCGLASDVVVTKHIKEFKHI